MPAMRAPRETVGAADTHWRPATRLATVAAPMASPRRSAKTRPVAQSLEQRLENHTARLAVIGLGYVGLPLAVEMAQAGFEVVGIDIDEKRVKQLNQGQSYIQDVPTADVAELVR